MIFTYRLESDAMARLSLTTRKRKLERKAIICMFWKQVMSVAAWFVTMLCTVVVIYRRRKRCIPYSRSRNRARVDRLLEVVNAAGNSLAIKIKQASEIMSEAIEGADVDVETKMRNVSSEMAKIASLSGVEMFRAMNRMRD